MFKLKTFRKISPSVVGRHHSCGRSVDQGSRNQEPLFGRKGGVKPWVSNVLDLILDTLRTENFTVPTYK